MCGKHSNSYWSQTNIKMCARVFTQYVFSWDVTLGTMTLYVCVCLHKPSDMSVSRPLCIWAKSKPIYVKFAGVHAFVCTMFTSHFLWLCESREGEAEKRKVSGKRKIKPENRESQGSLKNKNFKGSYHYDNHWNRWMRQRNDTASTQIR